MLDVRAYICLCVCWSRSATPYLLVCMLIPMLTTTYTVGTSRRNIYQIFFRALQ